MGINLIWCAVILGLLTATALGLHLQTDEKIYDAEAYQQQLQNRQDKLKQDLAQIRSMFEALDKRIQLAVDDPNQQLRLLQEGIADERDSLYNIQQYLNLPYNQRACQCINFSEPLRSNFTKQLALVEKSLAEVDAKAKECKDCPIAEEVQSQLKISSGYLQTMKDTISAKCCKKYTVIYIDNLNASNWQYGQTKAQYELWMSQQVTQTKKTIKNQTIVRSCPVYSPYTSPDLLLCSQCTQAGFVFNLKTRQCQQCPTGKIFNYEKHTCDYNVICPAGTVFDEKTIMCEKIIPAFNSSLCPPDRPVWNQQLLGCFKCNSSTPYYDINLAKCTACPANYTYNPKTNECYHQNCKPGQIYNEVTKECQNGRLPVTQTTNSQCPSDRPYWDKASLSCSRCPSESPYYNNTIKQCQSCPVNSTYDRSRNQCMTKCLPGQRLNTVTLKCENVTTPVNNGTQVSLCPPERPIWNAETKSCSKCATDKPVWNPATNSCQHCPLNQVLNPNTDKCQSLNSTVSCPPGTTFNANTNTCTKVGGTIGYCPPEKPFYNTQTFSCSMCPLDKPYFNKITRECEQQQQKEPVDCPTGYKYDQQAQACVQQRKTGIIAQCPPSAPMWDPIRGACVACGNGLVWDANLKSCVPCADPKNCVSGPTPSTGKTCPFDYEFDEGASACVKCRPYQKYNNITKKCADFCKVGEVYDSNYETCHGTISKCPVNLIFDQSQLRCRCAEGLNFKYDRVTYTCSQACSSNQKYNGLTNGCEPL